MTNPITATSKSYLDGLDLARYLAFVGMVMVNFKVAMGAESDQGLANLLTELLEGRAAAIFVVVAGMGLGLSSLRQQSLLITLKRAAFLLVLGLLNMLVFEADIIHYYALYFFFGVLLLGCSNRTLIGVVIGLNLAFVTLLFVLDYDTGWNWTEYSYSDFWTPVGFVRNLFFNGWHPVIPWLGFFLFGMMLGRINLNCRVTQRRLMLWGGGVFLAIEIFSASVTPTLVLIDPELAYLFSTHPLPPMPLYTVAGGSIACFVIGCCLLVSETAKRLGILQIIAPAGRQTLTLYIAHILLGMGALEMLGLLEGQSITTAVLAAGLFCILATIYALLWSRIFRRGPIENIMRKATG